MTLGVDDQGSRAAGIAEWRSAVAFDFNLVAAEGHLSGLRSACVGLVEPPDHGPTGRGSECFNGGGRDHPFAPGQFLLELGLETQNGLEIHADLPGLVAATASGFIIVGMKALETRLQRAKEHLLSEIGDSPWLRGVGFGLVGDAPGIVISVDPAQVTKVRRIVEVMSLSVPVKVRALGQVRKRASSAGHGHS
jgi:hypothetical protein